MSASSESNETLGNWIFDLAKVPLAREPVSAPVGVDDVNSVTAIGPAESATAVCMCAIVAPVIPVTFTLNRIVESLSSSNVADPVPVLTTGVGRSLAPVKG